MTLIPNDHPFNDPTSIEQSLKEFKNINWDGKILQDVINEYFKRFASLPLYKNVVKKDTVLFRGRINGKDELFDSLDKISITPQEYVKSFGRANIPKQAVFYCSTNEETVVREVTQWYINDSGRFQDLLTKGVIGMNWNPNVSMITISAWRVTEDLHLALLFGNEEKRSLAVQECHKHRMQVAKNSNFEKSRNLIIDFFSQEFGKLNVRHEMDYLYSAYYAYEVYNSNFESSSGNSIKFDGVKYASIANDIRGENIAICEEAFRNKIEFLGANFCYTLNTQWVPLKDTNNTATIGNIQSALLKNDNTFKWIDASNDYDYIAKVEGEYYPITFPREKGFKYPVIRVGKK